MAAMVLKHIGYGSVMLPYIWFEPDDKLYPIIEVENCVYSSIYFNKTWKSLERYVLGRCSLISKFSMILFCWNVSVVLDRSIEKYDYYPECTKSEGILLLLNISTVQFYSVLMTASSSRICFVLDTSANRYIVHRNYLLIDYCSTS